MMTEDSKKPVLIDLTANSPPFRDASAVDATTTLTACRISTIQPRQLLSSSSPSTGTAITTQPSSANNTPSTFSISPTAAIKNPYSSSKTKPVMVNPYAKKPPPPASTSFVGGAEKARVNARKRQGKKIDVPKQAKTTEVVNRTLHAFDRFFIIMLTSAAADYLKAATKDQVAKEIWHACCRRAGVPPCENPVAPVYLTAPEHCSVRAALVMEEARHSISAGLETCWKQRKQPLYMTGVSQERVSRSGILKVTFRKSSGKFAKDELYNIRPGSIVQCMLRDDQPIVNNAYLGVITTGSRDMVETQRSFTCSFFAENMPDLTKLEVSMAFVTQLVTECRCFEALTTMPHLPFMSQLLGSTESQRKGVHTRFDDGKEKEDKKPEKTIEQYFQPKPVKQEEYAKKLNKTQEDAANSFLNSAAGTISIVQGPPGTGKTTLLVSIIGRALLQAREEGIEGYRLMVSAPTNKAISVLASRFMESIIDEEQFNVILVGDQDKLLVDERNTNAIDGKLKPIFLYSWIETVTETYKRIKAYFMPQYRGHDEVPTLYRLARQQHHRLKKGLRCLDQTILDRADEICDSLDSGAPAHDIVSDIDKLLGNLKDMSNDVVWMNLIASADVIFCTLASSGGTVLKNKGFGINDLIVDEAAASTEPELYIPFHLRPSRLLIVGDPLQLPATCLSRQAIQLGLTKSLHERLMYDCQFEHVMLDVQYRMSCEISSFPSAHFYQSKIGNGTNVAGSEYFEGRVLLDRLPYTFLNVEGVEKRGFSGSFYNQIEATAIVDLIEQLESNSSPRSGSPSSAWHSSNRIRVITFYQAQVVEIQNALKKRGYGNKIVVATVDSSQGCEADIVLISFVRSPMRDDPRPSHGFLQDDRRVNVALTRARYQLVCVGNVKEFHRFVADKTETIHSLAQNAHDRDIIRTPDAAFRAGNTLDNFYGPPNKKQRVKSECN